MSDLDEISFITKCWNSFKTWRSACFKLFQRSHSYNNVGITIFRYRLTRVKCFCIIRHVVLPLLDCQRAFETENQSTYSYAHIFFSTKNPNYVDVPPPVYQGVCSGKLTVQSSLSLFMSVYNDAPFVSRSSL